MIYGFCLAKEEEWVNHGQIRLNKTEEHNKKSIFYTKRTHKSKGEMKYITNLSFKCRTQFALGDNFMSEKAQEHQKI